MATQKALKEAGFDIKKTDTNLVYPEELTRIDDETHHLYDPSVAYPVDEALVTQIGLVGMLNAMDAIDVRRDGTQLVIVDGRRRHLAAVTFNERSPKLRQRCEVKLFRGSDQEAVLRAISKNAVSHRLENTGSKAIKVRNALACGCTRAEVMAHAHLGRDESIIDKLLSYFDLVPEAQRAVDTHLLSNSAAAVIVAVASVPRSKQAGVVAQLAETAETNGKLKAHQLKGAVEAATKGQSYQPSERKRAYGRAVLARWVETDAAQRKITIAACVAAILGDDSALAKEDPEALAALKDAAGGSRRIAPNGETPPPRAAGGRTSAEPGEGGAQN